MRAIIVAVCCYYRCHAAFDYTESVDHEQTRRVCDVIPHFCVPNRAELWALVHAAWDPEEQLVLVDVGANKGFVAAKVLKLWSPACQVSPRVLYTAVRAHFAERGVHASATGPCPLEHLKRERPAAQENRRPCGVAATVHGFEPSPALFEMAQTLQRGALAASAPAWRWYPLAFSDYIGMASFSAVWHEGSAIKSSPIAHKSGHKAENSSDPNAARTVTVRVTTLDAWVAANRDIRPNVVKIDAEGQDTAVLAGASELITSRSLKLLIWEASDKFPIELAGRAVGSARELVSTLEDVAGMTCYLLGLKYFFRLTNSSIFTESGGLFDRRHQPECFRHANVKNIACVQSGTRLGDAFFQNSLFYRIEQDRAELVLTEIEGLTDLDKAKKTRSTSQGLGRGAPPVTSRVRGNHQVP